MHGENVAMEEGCSRPSSILLSGNHCSQVSKVRRGFPGPTLALTYSRSLGPSKGTAHPTPIHHRSQHFQTSCLFAYRKQDPGQEPKGGRALQATCTNSSPASERMGLEMSTLPIPTLPIPYSKIILSCPS